MKKNKWGVPILGKKHFQYIADTLYQLGGNTYNYMENPYYSVRKVSYPFYTIKRIFGSNKVKRRDLRIIKFINKLQNSLECDELVHHVEEPTIGINFWQLLVALECLISFLEDKYVLKEDIIKEIDILRTLKAEITKYLIESSMEYHVAKYRVDNR